MFGITLTVLKRSESLYDLNGSHSLPASNQSLNGDHLDPDPNGVVRSQSCKDAMFGIELKALKRSGTL